ncbi:uncharacterized protein HD556DRAFT_1440919 [Suillus plorans]|uniref:Uncharacterized protein n=1 Tax=Suillus plorans TaxID=116603 RepID=A0A9P7IYA3_9AGAM|nr:uncharacterized protein HD556DRAFT_1440919 [Suillus plorans]KAG1797360.1 hypothetical protein HD556DRAFT_1440919 [Suillus plorans]
MARTRMTAPRATGGLAPRKVVSAKVKPGMEELPHNLQAAKAATGGAVPPQVQEMARSYLDVHPEPSQNEFCMLCQDGAHGAGHCIYECNENGCPCGVCTNCISIPNIYLQDVMQPSVVFRCIHCHTARDNTSREVTPYYGFYMDNKPILPSFLPIVGQLQLSKRSEISATPILIIHFKLVGFETTATPIDAVHSYLSPYFPNGGLRLVEVVFDLGTARKVDTYSWKCEAPVKEIMEGRNYQRVCIAITDHTNDDNGDPFLGYDKETNGSYVATTVPDFMDTLLDLWREVFQRANNTTLFFFSCGALVNHPESFGGLSQCAGKHKLTSIVAFTAKHFHLSMTYHFMTTFAQLVLIEGFTLREAFPSILDQSGLGMHTELILMTMSTVPSRDSASDPECTRYSYAHTKARPWGCTLPMQCAQCGCPTVWKRIEANVSQMSATFQCSFKDCGKKGNGRRSLPKSTYTCKAPKGSKLLPGKNRNAGWLEIPVYAATGFLRHAE